MPKRDKTTRRNAEKVLEKGGAGRNLAKRDARIGAAEARAVAVEGRAGALETQNANQAALLQQRADEISALNTQVDNLRERIVALENFRDRAGGFSASQHAHPWSELPNAGVHDNVLHDPNYQPA